MEPAKATSADTPLYDRRAAKKPTQLRINGDLLSKAEELGINPASILEEALAEEVAAKRREIWREENREAIAAYNDLVREHGVFSDGLRGF
jgi:antitoxin CcdA